jgi:ribosomal protein L11 methyltransferase
MGDLLEFILPIATIDPEHEAVTRAQAWLAPQFHGGAVVEVSGFGPYGETDHAQVLLRGYLYDTPEHRRQVAAILQALPHRPLAEFYGEPRLNYLATADWAEVWKQHYHAMRIGEHVVISPQWEQPELGPDDVLIELEPGMAFGTGTHPSTQLILRLLERYLPQKAVLLDVGTGSGILAIAAIKLGAGGVVATDIDPDAVRTAQENAALNQVLPDIDFAVGSVPASGVYPLVMANILADVLADLLLHHHLSQRVAPGGILLLSGIIQQRREVVDLALRVSGLTLIDVVEDGDWLAMAVRREG